MSAHDEVKVSGLIEKNYKEIKKHPGNIAELTRISKLLETVNSNETKKEREEIECFRKLNKLAFNHLSQSMSDVEARNWNNNFIKIKSKSPVIFTLDNSPIEYTIEDFYIKYFSYMAKSVSRYTKRSAEKVFLTLPSHFNILQRTQIKTCVEKAGLECAKILPISSMKILSTEKKSKKPGKHFMIDMNSSTFEM
jgi:hypothetical protein